MTLKLSAKVVETGNPERDMIQLYLDGVLQIGGVCVDVEYADELLALLNAATELREVHIAADATLAVVLAAPEAHECPALLGILAKRVGAVLAKAKGTT